MRKLLVYALVIPLLFTLGASVGWTQQAGTYRETIPAGSGTVSYTVVVTSNVCHVDGGGNQEVSYFTSYFSDFSYKVSGVTTSLSGTDYTVDIKDGGPGCPSLSYPSVTLTGTGVQIYFKPTVFSTTQGTATVE